MEIVWCFISFSYLCDQYQSSFEHCINVIDTWIMIVFFIFVLPLSQFNIVLLFRICRHWSANFMETYFKALGSIPIIVVSLLANLPISSIFPFKQRFSVALSPSTKLFLWHGAFIALSIIIPYEDGNTVLKYINKAHLYWFSQPSVSSHTVDIPETNSTDPKINSIDETYEYVNHMHIVHCCHLYMNGIQIFFLLPISIEVGKYSTAIPSIDNCLFLPQCWLCISILVVLLNFYAYSCFNFILFVDALAQKQSFLVLLHSIEPIILTLARWNESFFIVGIYKNCEKHL